MRRHVKYCSTGCPEELFARESAKDADLLAQVMRVLFGRLQVTSTAV